ncbi:MAG: DMT family transporter [Ruminococcaceae bacterium]|nr:DMT family transporter [Oscillospiraceae bacterium]
MHNGLNKQSLVGSGMLLLAAVIWGCAFVAQSVAMDHIGPFSFGSVRFFIGAAVLLPVIAWRKKRALHTAARPQEALLGGLVCGGFLFLASASQQIGLMYTTVGKSGFITALYVVLVPLVGFVLFRRRVSPLLALGALAAMIGLYLLCGENGFSVNRGDAYTLACAVLFAAQILAVDHFVTRVDGVLLSCLQFTTSGILNGITALIFEPALTWQMLAATWLPLCYTGILSSGVAYTLQILGQKRTQPAVASLLMSLESVFAVLAGAVILTQWPTLREAIGCVVMFAAVILAQVPTKER